MPLYTLNDRGHALQEYSVSGLLFYQIHYYFFFYKDLFQFKFLPSAKDWNMGWGKHQESRAINDSYLPKN